MPDITEDLWICDYCGKGFNPNKDKFWIKKNITDAQEAMSKGTLCIDCVNYGIDLIDLLDFEIIEDEEDLYEIFKEAVKVAQNKIANKSKEKSLPSQEIK